MTQFNKPPNTIYVIRKGDMVIRPTFDDHQQPNGSEILKFDTSREISPLKLKIIERSCRFYGITTCKKAETQRIAGITSKPPILLTPLFPTYFFPTHSDRLEENIWINMHYISDITIKTEAHIKCIFFIVYGINILILFSITI